MKTNEMPDEEELSDEKKEATIVSGGFFVWVFMFGQ